MMLFNPPPQWPLAAGFSPSPEWEPDPSWPPAPQGWQFFVDPGEVSAGEADSAAADPAPQPRPRLVRTIALWIALPLAPLVVITIALVAIRPGDQQERIKLLPITYSAGTPVPATLSTPNGWDWPPSHGPAAGSGKWTDPDVLITPTAIGGVQLGMTLDQAEAAASVSLPSQGDGVHGAPPLAPGGPRLAWHPGCLSATGDSSAGTVQSVHTLEGFALGADVKTLLDVYGSAAHFVPAPQEGRTPAEGFVVDYPRSTMTFVVTNDHITSIAIGDSGLTPSSCGS